MIADASFNQFFTDSQDPDGNYGSQFVYTRNEAPRDAFMYLCAWQSEINAGREYAHINDGEDSIYVLGANSPYLSALQIDYQSYNNQWAWMFEFYLPYDAKGLSDELIPVAIIDRYRRVILRNPEL